MAVSAEFISGTTYLVERFTKHWLESREPTFSELVAESLPGQLSF